MKVIGSFSAFILFAPQVAFGADYCQTINNFKTAVGCALSLMSYAVVLLVGFALISFLYGLLKYVSEGGNAEARTKASLFIIYGTIGLFVMISVYGLVNVLLDTFGFSDYGGASSSVDGGTFDVYGGSSDSGTNNNYDPYAEQPGGTSDTGGNLLRPPFSSGD